MSKGTPIVPVRIPPELQDEIWQAIERRNETTKEEPWTRTGFILTAIREKLDKMERSRKSKPKKKSGSENKLPDS